MLHYRFCALLLFVFSLTFLTGCGQKGPKVNYVEGIVTLDGNSVQGVDVNFVPRQTSDSNDLTGALLSSGRTDASGKYKLSTTRGSAVDAGTTTGEYKVSFVKKKQVFGQGGPGSGPPRWEYGVPQVFEEADKSTTFVEVVKGKNTFNFALKSDGTFEVMK
jgi:hypothetical protein